MARTHDIERDKLLQQAARRAMSFLDELPERPVAPRIDLEALRGALAGGSDELPEDGVAADRVLAELDESARPALMASAGPRFFGFVVGGAYPVAIAADWLVSAWDQNAGLYVLSPAVSVIEETTARWMLKLLGLPATASVGFVTGGQMANFTALAAARHEMLRRIGWDVDTQGLVASPGIDIVASDEAHITIHRALRFLGIGTDAVRAVATDDQGRMRPADLAKVLGGCTRPTIVCAQAGDVNSGAFDHFSEIVPLVRERGAWLHIDGAFGLWVATTDDRRHLTHGIEGADSWAVDAHKWLNVPQDCGVAIVAHPQAHRAAISTSTAYLIKSGGAERDPVDWSPEFSRRARSVPVYATLRYLGRRGIAELVDRCCCLAQHLAHRLAASPHVELLNEVVLNQALIRFVAPGHNPDDLTRAVIRRIQDDRTCWFGGTSWKGKAAMRVSVINATTTENDCDRAVQTILLCLAAELESGG